MTTRWNFLKEWNGTSKYFTTARLVYFITKKTWSKFLSYDILLAKDDWGFIQWSLSLVRYYLQVLFILFLIPNIFGPVTPHYTPTPQFVEYINTFILVVGATGNSGTNTTLHLYYHLMAPTIVYAAWFYPCSGGWFGPLADSFAHGIMYVHIIFNW